MPKNSHRPLFHTQFRLKGRGGRNVAYAETIAKTITFSTQIATECIKVLLKSASIGDQAAHSSLGKGAVSR